MIQNRISATLTQEQAAKILDALKVIQNELPFLISLTKGESRRMIKMGPKSKSFVEKGLEVAALHPELFPSYIKASEIKKDLDLYSSLLPVQITTNRIATMLSHTMLLLGSEAFSAALVVYKQLQQVAGAAGLDDVLKEMSARFAQASKDEDEDEPKP